MNAVIRARHAVICALFVLPIFPSLAVAAEQAKVNGTLTEVDGIPVLRVWGTPEERGYAHGYLLAEMIKPLANDYLTYGPLGGSVERYEKQSLPKLGRMTIDPQYEAEMRGVLAGVEARLDGPMQVPFLGRALRYEDIVAINCTGDLVRSGCSSFAAWGKMTEGGHTIAGRNMDWPIFPGLADTLVVVANVPSPDSGRLGWVSVTWPSYVGCLTGMNQEGVTVATHDAPGRGATVTGGFTPYGWTFRQAVESAHAQTAIEDIARVIREHISIVGNNMVVTRPYTGDGPGAVVFEFDADVSADGGLTTRGPEGEQPFLVCTNHFRKRSAPTECRRYSGLMGTLERIAKSGGQRQVTPARAWKMLEGVSIEGILTYHSVVFEPNRRLMHVAFTQNGKHAPKCKVVTLDVAKLLAGD